MVMTDPIADLLTRIRNGNMANHEHVDIPASSVKNEVARILKEEGYIKDFKVIPDSKQGSLRVYLKYGPNNEKIITGIERVSKPGCRLYYRAKEIPDVLNKLGIAVISTSSGIMTGTEAKKRNIGGEILCKVW